MILALFLAGYLGQQYLPPPKPKVIGLDLGTTFCSVGVFHPGSGDVEVIADEEGRKSIPSAVSFTTTAVLAGHEAVDLADSNPQSTIYDSKRFIGKIFEPEVLEQESARYPFKVGHAGAGGADCGLLCMLLQKEGFHFSREISDLTVQIMTVLFYFQLLIGSPERRYY